MSWSIGANAPTKTELKTKLAEANAATGGRMPDTVAGLANGAIDLLPEIATLTIAVSGNIEDDPEKQSRVTILACNKS
jgi:hypothetical protein